MSASSVAPAQVTPATGPLILVESDQSPQLVIPEVLPIDTPVETAQAVEDVTPEPVRPAADLATLVVDMRSSDAGSRELECLAVGIYYEAKSESLAGQLAVGKVIANRANSKGRFPPSYCGVLFQRSQFSFIRGRSLPSVPRASRQWQTAVAVAKIVDQDLKDSAAENALFFHARHVSPGWRLKRVATIGNHIFYR